MNTTTNTAPPRFVLTTSCPDTTGVVAAISGFLATHHCLITEAQHYDDPFSNTSFMRTVFHDNGGGAPAIAELDRMFATAVGERFRMDWKFHEVRRRCRAIVAVSKHGHCLNSLLHRWSTGTLPIEVSTHACEHFAGRAINIHHSFLPGFKVAKAYHQAHARAVKLIGATAHYVTTDLDEGPIIEQEVERVDHSQSPEDLVDIGRDLESVVLNRAVRWHAERRVFQNGGKTVVLR